MRLERIDPRQQKGWWVGPWNSDLAVAVGWATAGIDAPHQHQQMTEIYLVTNGTAIVRVKHETITLTAGNVLIIAPGEAHTFLDSSEDYRHFVIHTPALPPTEAHADHLSVPRAELGLA